MEETKQKEKTAAELATLAVDYPRAEKLGWKSAQQGVYQYPTDINWNSHLTLRTVNHYQTTGQEFLELHVKATDAGKAYHKLPFIQRACVAMRNCILQHVPVMVPVQVLDRGTATHTLPIELGYIIGRVPVLGYEPFMSTMTHREDITEPLTEFNHLLFELNVDFDASRQQVSQSYEAKVRTEAMAKSSLIRTFGPVSTDTLRTVPPMLLPGVPSRLQPEQGAVPPLKMILTPLQHMVVMSQDAVWLPVGMQRAKWLEANGLEHETKEKQDEVLRLQGPRLKPNFTMTKIVEGQCTRLTIICQVKTGLESTTYLAGGAPTFAPNPTIHILQPVTGAAASKIYNACPKKCFGLRRVAPISSSSSLNPIHTSTLVDIEDLDTLLSELESAEEPFEEPSMQLSIENEKDCTDCGQCSDIHPLVQVRMGDSYRFRIESHSVWSCEELLSFSLNLLQSRLSIFNPS